MRGGNFLGHEKAKAKPSFPRWNFPLEKGLKRCFWVSSDFSPLIDHAQFKTLITGTRLDPYRAVFSPWVIAFPKLEKSWAIRLLSLSKDFDRSKPLLINLSGKAILNSVTTCPSASSRLILLLKFSFIPPPEDHCQIQNIIDKTSVAQGSTLYNICQAYITFVHLASKLKLNSIRDCIHRLS